jgi:hypothetical protein
MAELAKPGRDPRETFEAFAFAGHVSEMKDLEAGMQLPGIVTNVTAVRRLRGHRRAPGRPGARERTGRPLRQGPGRGGQGAAKGGRSPCLSMEVDRAQAQAHQPFNNAFAALGELGKKK